MKSYIQIFMTQFYFIVSFILFSHLEDANILMPFYQNWMILTFFIFAFRALYILLKEKEDTPLLSDHLLKLNTFFAWFMTLSFLIFTIYATFLNPYTYNGSKLILAWFWLLLSSVIIYFLQKSRLETASFTVPMKVVFSFISGFYLVTFILILCFNYFDWSSYSQTLWILGYSILLMILFKFSLPRKEKSHDISHSSF